MWPALWFPVRVGARRIPVPLLLVLVPAGVWTRRGILVSVGTGFVLSRLAGA